MHVDRHVQNNKPVTRFETSVWKPTTYLFYYFKMFCKMFPRSWNERLWS